VRGGSRHHSAARPAFRIESLSARSVVKRTIALAFSIGVLAHVLFWALVVNLDSTPMDWTCGEVSCWVLFVFELPFSVLYISGSAGQVTITSLFVGSLWWGAAAFCLVYLALKLRRQAPSANPEPRR
jgi:hypothetical protein